MIARKSTVRTQRCTTASVAGAERDLDKRFYALTESSGVSGSISVDSS